MTRLSSSFRTATGIRKERALTNDELMRYVPSVFSEEKHQSRSERYTYIPTITLLNNLRHEGFQPFFACQTRVRDQGKREHTKHMLRLRREGQIAGSEVPEIILLNSHDGSSSYQMIPGMFRFVCMNGMVCGQTFGEIRVPHKGDIVGRVIEGAYEVLDIFDGIRDSSGQMKSIQLTADEQKIFAETALNWKYDDKGEGKHIPLVADDVLMIRREEDKPNDLWTTYQRVQENMTKGGLWGKNAKGKFQRTRPVRGIDGDIKLNRALWEMAEKMKAIKS
jgi:predicted RNA-binding protein